MTNHNDNHELEPNDPRIRFKQPDPDKPKSNFVTPARVTRVLCLAFSLLFILAYVSFTEPALKTLSALLALLAFAVFLVQLDLSWPARKHYKNQWLRRRS